MGENVGTTLSPRPLRPGLGQTGGLDCWTGSTEEGWRR